MELELRLRKMEDMLKALCNGVGMILVTEAQYNSAAGNAEVAAEYVKSVLSLLGAVEGKEFADKLKSELISALKARVEEKETEDEPVEPN